LKHIHISKHLLRPALTILWPVLLLTVSACNNPGLFFANSLARFDNYTVTENIAYGKHELNRLSVYLPENKQSHPATIIFFYGGCWGGCETLNKEQYLFVAQALTAKGFNVVIPDYRRHPEVKLDGIMRDATQSVEWVKAHIADYSGDPKRLFLMGHSAGAHIAAMLTLNEKHLTPSTYRNIKGFMGLAGPYDFLPFTDDYQKIVFGPVENYPNTQPVNFVDGTEPPLLLLYGNDDDMVKPINIESLNRTVKQKGGCVESHRYDGLDHTDLLGALSIPLQVQQPVMNDLVDFVNYYAEGNKTCKH
jgi:acetyl esterase/lipase